MNRKMILVLPLISALAYGAQGSAQDLECAKPFTVTGEGKGKDCSDAGKQEAFTKALDAAEAAAVGKGKCPKNCPLLFLNRKITKSECVEQVWNVEVKEEYECSGIAVVPPSSSIPDLLEHQQYTDKQLDKGGAPDNLSDAGKNASPKHFWRLSYTNPKDSRTPWKDFHVCITGKGKGKDESPLNQLTTSIGSATIDRGFGAEQTSDGFEMTVDEKKKCASFKVGAGARPLQPGEKLELVVIVFRGGQHHAVYHLEVKATSE